MGFALPYRCPRGTRKIKIFLKFCAPPAGACSDNKKPFKYPYLHSKGGYLRFFVALQSGPPFGGGPRVDLWALGFVSFLFFLFPFLFFSFLSPSPFFSFTFFLFLPPFPFSPSFLFSSPPPPSCFVMRHTWHVCAGAC